MKRLKYSGTYIVKPGDFLIYTDGGKSIITEHESRDKKLGKLMWTCVGSKFKWNKSEKIGGKLMLTIGSNYKHSHFYIHNGLSAKQRMYLHCDGRVINVCEYFESYAAAEAVLDKYYPKPKHEWKHGDVFVTRYDSDTMMYLHPEKKFGKRKPQVIYVDSDTHAYSDPETYLCGAKFLFNIKEKL